MNLPRPSNQTKKYYKEQDNSVTNFKKRLLLNNTQTMGKFAFEQ